MLNCNQNTKQNILISLIWGFCCKFWDLATVYPLHSVIPTLFCLQLDTDEFTVENAISKDFDALIHLNLDPIWHQLSAKSKQLVADIKMLRLILE